MKKVLSILFIVSLVLTTLMAQPITEQQKLPLEQRYRAFQAAMEKNPQHETDILKLQQRVLVEFQERMKQNPIGIRTDRYQPLKELVLQTLRANDYPLDWAVENVFKLVGDIEKRYYGIDFTSQIEGFDEIYALVSSDKDFDHVMKDESNVDILVMLNSPNHAGLWDSAAKDFALYAKSFGFYFTQEEAKEIIVAIFTRISEKRLPSFEERAEDFFRVMKDRPDFVEDIKKLNEGFIGYLCDNMGNVITQMTNAEFYTTPLLTAIDEILLAEGLDLDDEEFGAYISAFYHASTEENYKSDLPKFDSVFAKAKGIGAKENMIIGIKNLVHFFLNAPGNEERMAIIGANFASYAATKGFVFTAEEGARLVKEQLQYFLENN